MPPEPSRIAWAAQSQVNWGLKLLAGAAACIRICTSNLDSYAKHPALTKRMKTRCTKVANVLWHLHKAIEEAQAEIKAINKEPS